MAGQMPGNCRDDQQGPGILHRKRLARANPQAYDELARERLRRLSLELTGLAPAPTPSA